MGQFARILRGLQDVFPPSGRENVGVSELSETVSPVFPFPGRQGSLDRVTLFSGTSTSVVTPALVIGINVDDRTLFFNAGSPTEVQSITAYLEILAADLSHDSVTNRALQLFLQTPGAPSINTSIGRFENFASARVAGQVSGFMPMVPELVSFANPAAGATLVVVPHFPLIIPPGWKLLITGDTAAAAYAITSQLAAIIHPIAEEPFWAS